jgi:hypothetical protein
VTAQALFDEVSERLLAEDAALERTRMMGSEGLKTGGRLMKEWVALIPADEAACAAYVTEAQRFVGG